MKDSIVVLLKQINWEIAENRDIAHQLAADVKEYISRVVDHIYTGNEIRSDSFMDAFEKQDEIRRLDRRRTVAHDKMLKSFAPFLRLLNEQTSFKATNYRLENRTQIADYVALIAFELIGMAPEARAEGSIRDELAEKIHLEEITFEHINNQINDLLYGGSK